MKSLRWVMSYSLAAFIGLFLAFVITMKVMTPAKSQEAPSSGELPAEFSNEVQNQGTASPPPSTQGTVAPASTATATPPQSPTSVKGGSETKPVLSQGLLTGEDYFYDPTGKRDPFKPVGLKALGLAKPIVLEPLQRFDLDKLQVVGILWDVRSPRAMIRDPNGVMHTVIKNSRMGRAEGFVAAIREGEIVIVETLYEDGKTLKQTRVLELKK